MTGALNRIERLALAEHIKDSKAFMTEQRLKAAENPRTEETNDVNSIFTTLAPFNEALDYYICDHQRLCRLRHPGTCEWILKHPKFLGWSQTPVGKNSALHSNNGSAAILSMMYQLYKQHENQESRAAIKRSVGNFYGSAGDGTRSSFLNIWHGLWFFLQDPLNVVLILDGLDECQDSHLLVPNRREKYLVKHLKHLETLEITPEDLHHDIRKFAEYKIGRNPRLSHPTVCDTVLKGILSHHDGMFLWVYLMLKELKACISAEEVQMTLLQIPSGLEATYISIVQRLQKSLTRRAAETTRKILTWVLGSARSLSMDELREALFSQYQLEGQILLSSGEFPYAEKDIELMCGSLISIRDGQIRTVHQSTKGYLIGMSSDQRLSMDRAILPNSIETSLQIASVCLTYLNKFCTSSIGSLQNPSLRTNGGTKSSYDPRKENKLIEYTCFFWVHHVLDCPSDNRENVLALIARHFSYFMTLSWIVTTLLLDSRGLWRLFIGVEEIQDWLCDGKTENERSNSERHVREWCLGVLEVFKSYGTLLLERPGTVWRLDLTAFIGAEQPLLASSNRSSVSKESEHVFQGSIASPSRLQRILANTQLGHNQWSLFKARLGFFVYDRNQKIFLSGEMRTEPGEECLFVQHAETGRRLSSATASLAIIGLDNKRLYGLVITAKISCKGRYFAIAYNSWVSVWVIERNLAFSHRLKDREWAFRLLTHRYDKHTQSKTSEVIAFGEDDKLFVPEGWYNLLSKEFHPCKWYETLDHPDAVTTISFSGDGSHVFTEQQRDSSKHVVCHSTNLGFRNSIAHTFQLGMTWNIRPSNTGNIFYYLKHQDGVITMNAA
ncbi:Serine active site containing protein 1 [Sticta canariensis]|nr:Serine active site containing protein 1 [Sticta canariensis]